MSEMLKKVVTDFVLERACPEENLKSEKLGPEDRNLELF